MSVYIFKKNGVFTVTDVGVFWHRLRSCLPYLLVFLPDPGTEEPKNSPRAAAGRARQTVARTEAADVHCGLFPTHGCSAPHCCTHLSAKQRSLGAGLPKRQVWDVLLHISGKAERRVSPLSEQPGDRAGDGRKSVQSYPSLQPQGLGFGGYPDFGAT